MAQPRKAHHLLEAVQPGGWPTEFVILDLGRVVSVSLVTGLISPDLKDDSIFTFQDSEQVCLCQGKSSFLHVHSNNLYLIYY